MELHELEHKTVTELREMAHQYDELVGVIGMKKEQLLEILCEKLGIDRHVHVPTGIGRHDLKARIRNLKTRRNKALEAHDAAALADARHEIRSTKRKLRRIITRATRAEPAKPKAPAGETAG